jgi:hypothetical protein
MEDFASDGGIVRGETSRQTARLSHVDSGTNQLWEYRLNSIGLPPVLPDITSGGAVVLAGYGAAGSGDASQDMLYKIGKNTANPLLRISVPGAAGLRAYVALTDGGEGQSAELYPLEPGEENLVYTKGLTAWLFLATRNQSQNTTATFAWAETPGGLYLSAQVAQNGSVSGDIWNVSGGGVTGGAYLAAYDQRGMMLGLKIQPCILADGERAALSYTDAPDSAVRYQLFVLSNELAPLTHSLAIPAD